MRPLALISALVLLGLSGCASSKRVDVLESQVKWNQSFAWDQWFSIERHTLEIERMTTRLNKVAPLDLQDMTREQLLQMNGALLKRIDSLKALVPPPSIIIGSVSFDTVQSVLLCPSDMVVVEHGDVIECDYPKKKGK